MVATTGEPMVAHLVTVLDVAKVAPTVGPMAVRTAQPWVAELAAMSAA